MLLSTQLLLQMLIVKTVDFNVTAAYQLTMVLSVFRNNCQAKVVLGEPSAE